MTSSTQKPTVAVAVCTYNRNDPLRDLLHVLLANAERIRDRARLGVVIVDDSSDGKARSVAEHFEGQFELGLRYLRSGRRNISIARNMAIEAAAGIAEWVAMTDDDCEPVPHWIEALLDMQQRTHADAVCGLYRRRAPQGAPPWLTGEPFLEIALLDCEDGATLQLAGTNNSMISSRWWAAHRNIRFKPDLGVTGGEDVVFYRVFAERAAVFENEPASRTTLGYQLRHFFWLGNASYLTRLETADATPFRMFLQGGNQIRKALLRPIGRMWNRQTPQLRYCLALILYGVGLMVGPLGIRVPHH
jgi:glycosyltransferase involved in cell wall biosynthesis